MATQSPFSFLASAFEQLVVQVEQQTEYMSNRFPPPAWAVQEGQHRLVLLLNHVLQQEPEAQARLRRQSGKTALIQWRAVSLHLVATPAGLLDLATPSPAPDLTLSLTQSSPLELLSGAITGAKPEVRIEGDVQLAAEVNWLVDHLRWDIEEDLSRIVGDVAAHRLGRLGRALSVALKGFLALLPAGGASTARAQRRAP
jgi:ubiquinone biosynthesis accessory factor UbiJ